MNKEEKNIFDFINDLSEEDNMKLFQEIENINIENFSLSEAQKLKVKSKVINKLTNTNANKKPNKLRWIVAASIVSAFTLFFFSPFGQRALAEIANKFFFIPGYGKVIENKGTDVFILSKVIEERYKDSALTIKAAILDSQGLSISLFGDRDFIAEDFNSLKIKDLLGNKYVSTSSLVGRGKGWLGEYSFVDIPEDMREFTLVLPDNKEIPITLSKANSYIDYSSMGPTDIKNNLGITLITNTMEDKIKVNILNHPSDKREVALYGKSSLEGKSIFNVIVKDEKGTNYKIYYPESYLGTLREFTFIPSKEFNKYSIEIPEVTLRYKINNKITLPIPKEGEVNINKTLPLGNFSLNIIKVARKDNSLKIYVDTNYDESNPENLAMVYLEGGTLPLSSYSWEFDDNSIIKSYEIPINPKKREITLEFKEANTLLKGPWEFEISK